MIDPVYDECGIVATAWLGSEAGAAPGSQAGDAARLVPGMLLDIQNRGQLAAGMTTYLGDRPQVLRTHKALGPVTEAFQLADRIAHRALLERHAGSIAIGHTRYSTCGADDIAYAQPLERPHGKLFKWFSFAFNGNIANHRELAQKLQDDLGYHLIRTDSDTELFMHYLAWQQRGNKPTPWPKAFAAIDRVIDGAWSIAVANAAGELVVARDPSGIKPLCYGLWNGFLVVASESIALQNLGVEEIRDVEPGTLLHVADGHLETHRFATRKHKAHCFFEWIYFANVASTIDGRSVYGARAELGRAMARVEEERVTRDHIVVPVPDTSKAAGDAFAFQLGIPSIEGLVRNRYVGRTFIESDDRAAKVRRKFVALRGILEGKKVFLVDDSIVRSTTLKYLVDYVRSEGRAAEVHVRIACPPILSPCFYGIDMSTIGELFAPNFVRKPAMKGQLPGPVRAAMAAAIGADSLSYLPIDALPKAIGHKPDDLCMACVSRKYPTPAGRTLYRRAVARHQAGKRGRTTTA